jgi:hypothetical protein
LIEKKPKKPEKVKKVHTLVLQNPSKKKKFDPKDVPSDLDDNNTYSTKQDYNSISAIDSLTHEAESRMTQQALVWINKKEVKMMALIDPVLFFKSKKYSIR